MAFSAYLQIVPGLSLTVYYGILIHPHERGVIVCLGIGVTFAVHLSFVGIPVKLVGNLVEIVGSENQRTVIGSIVLRYDIVYLDMKDLCLP